MWKPSVACGPSPRGKGKAANNVVARLACCERIEVGPDVTVASPPSVAVGGVAGRGSWTWSRSGYDPSIRTTSLLSTPITRPKLNQNARPSSSAVTIDVCRLPTNLMLMIRRPCKCPSLRPDRTCGRGNARQVRAGLIGVARSYRKMLPFACPTPTQVWSGEIVTAVTGPESTGRSASERCLTHE